MTTSLTCESCGHRNELGRLFCIQCGAKLPPAAPQVVRGGAGRGRGGLLRGVRVVVLLGLCIALGLMIWPKRPAGQSGTEAQGRDFYRQVVNAEQALKAGREARVLATEPGINGYLDELVARTAASEGEGPLVTANLIRVDFRPAGVNILVLAKYGPLQFSYHIEAEPAFGARETGFAIRRAQFGHLPLPGPARGWLAARLASLFDARQREQFVFRRIADVELSAGKAVFLTTPESNGG